MLKGQDWERKGSRTRRLPKTRSNEGDSSDDDLLYCSMETRSDSDTEAFQSVNISARHVQSVLSQLDERKRILVKETGFGCLLELPELDEVDQGFTLWLLQKLKWWSGDLVYRQGCSIPLVPEHLEKLIGIPSAGTEVTSAAFKNLDSKIEFIEKIFGGSVSEHERIELAEKIVLGPMAESPTKEHIHRFKVAFVLFVMSTFLAPNKKNNHGNSDIWGALADSEKIHTFNWSSYVVNYISECARLLSWYSKKEKDLSRFTSCGILLQILYLDSIDLGELSTPHNIFPRIRAFNAKTVRAMILADKPHGLRKLRSPENSCYSAKDTTVGKIISSSSTILSVHETLTGQQAGTSKVKLPKMYRSHMILGKKKGQESPVNQTHSETTRTRIPDFGAYLRSKYHDKLDHVLLDALNYHNARCLEHQANFNNALSEAIINENIVLADKFMGYIMQDKISADAPKQASPKYRRRSFKELLSVPESEDEGLYNLPAKKCTRSPPIPLSPTGFISKGIADKRLGYDTPRGKESSDSESIVPNQTPKSLPRSQSQSVNNRTPEPLQSFQAPSQRNDDNMFRTPVPCLDKKGNTSSLSPTKGNIIFSEAVVAVRLLNSMEEINLNARALDSEFSVSPVQKVRAKICRYARSPWLLGYSFPQRDKAVTQMLFSWLNSASPEDLHSNWIMHEVPRFIEISGKHLKEQFQSGVSMSFDIFDIAVRRMKQLDLAMYNDHLPLIWRHFLESDFAMHVLGNSALSEICSVRDQFVGPLVNYEIASCQMVIVPVCIKQQWWCYFWDMKLREVFIIDPSSAGLETSVVISKHNGTIQILHSNLEKISTQLFEGWHQVWEDWGKTVVHVSETPIECSESGVYTLFSIKNFNGHIIQPKPTKTEITTFKESMLYELLGLQGNKGKKPGVYVEVIDD